MSLYARLLSLSAMLALTACATQTPVVSSSSSPSTLTATAASQSQVNLSWGSVAGTTEYFIERRAGFGSFETLVRLGSSTTAFSDRGVKADTTYIYSLKARNPAGQDTAFAATVTTPGGQASNPAPPAPPAPPTPAPPAPAPTPPPSNPSAPATPVGFTATATSQTQVNLKWSAAGGVAYYFVERRAGSGSYETLARVGAGDTEYTDQSAQPGSAYTYSLKARNGAGLDSAPATATVTTPSATTPTPPPPAPPTPPPAPPAPPSPPATGTVWLTGHRYDNPNDAPATVFQQVGGELRPFSTGGFGRVHRLLFDREGNLYLIQQQTAAAPAGRIAKYTAAQASDGSLQGDNPAWTINGGDCTSSVCLPNGGVFDAAGNLWVANFTGENLQCYSRDSLQSGSGLSARRTLSGPDFVSAHGIAFDAQGGLWYTAENIGVVGRLSPSQLECSGGAASVTPEVLLETRQGGPNRPSELVLDTSRNSLWVSDYGPWISDSTPERIYEIPLSGPNLTPGRRGALYGYALEIGDYQQGQSMAFVGGDMIALSNNAPLGLSSSQQGKLYRFARPSGSVAPAARPTPLTVSNPSVTTTQSGFIGVVVR